MTIKEKILKEKKVANILLIAIVALNIILMVTQVVSDEILIGINIVLLATYLIYTHKSCRCPKCNRSVDLRIKKENLERCKKCSKNFSDKVDK